MLYTADELRQTLSTDFEAIRQADTVEDALYASGVLAGRLKELDRLGFLQQGQRQSWLVDATQALSARRKLLDDVRLYTITSI